MAFYQSMNNANNYGQSWRDNTQTAGYQAQNYQEFGVGGKSSVKLHHNPGGKSNFSLAQTGEPVGEGERFNRIKPGVSQPFGAANYDVDETFHQRTATKNQSQIALGSDQSNPYKQHELGTFASYTKAVEQEDPRYPRKKGNFGDEQYENNYA